MEKFQSLADFLGVGPDKPVPDGPDLCDLTLSVKDFCKGILSSREYRLSVLQRIQLGTLPPAIESLMYHYAFGKPVDRIEHTGKDGRPIETTTEVRRVVVRAHAPMPDDIEEDAPREKTH